MTCETIGGLLLQRVAETLDEAGEQTVRDHLASCAACRHEADELQETWSLMGQMQPVPSTAAMRTRFYDMLTDVQLDERAAGQRSGWLQRLRRLWPQQAAWQVGIALAMLVFGLWLGPRVGFGAGSEIRELRTEMQSMTHAMTLSLLAHQSASERLRAVSLSERTGVDDDVAQALLRAINNDESVNVRLAALSVLSTMLDRPSVRAGLFEAVARQQAPTMQAALADVLLRVDGDRSRELIQELLHNEKIDEGVRDHIRRAMTAKENRT